MLEQVVDFSTLSSHLQAQAIKAIATEFYGASKVTEGTAALWRTLDNGNHFIKCVLWEDNLVGVSSYKVFHWEQIAPQLYYEAKFEAGKLSALRLRPFAEFINHLGSQVTVAEMVAYATILEGYRGRDFYRHLFVAKLHDIVSKTGASVVFALTRGDYATTEIVPKGTQYMLEVEQRMHGCKANGQVDVRGIWVDVEEFECHTGSKIAHLSFDSHSRGSHLTTLLAKEHGFIPLGFHRNFSVLLATTPDVIKQHLVW